MGQPLDFSGWLEDDFLSNDFGSGIGGESTGAQVQMQIVDRLTPIGVQAHQQLADAVKTMGAQAQMQIVDANSAVGSQVLRAILDFVRLVGVETEMHIADRTARLGMEVATSNILYQICGGFLTDDFLSGPFLGRELCAGARMQVHQAINDRTAPYGAQAQMQIVDATKRLGVQVEMQIVDALKTMGCQVFLFRATGAGAQVRFILYNIDRPRFLADFPSRGTTGLNWTATSTQPGDFSVNNVNNDVVEFYWRSADSVVAGVDLVCDTEVAQGVAVDTIAILEHNLTKSVSLIVQGSNDSGFASVGFEVTMPPMLRNTFWVAPTLPLQSFRYWRFRITDTTNTNGYLRIGTIIFGAAVIFQGECGDQRVRVGRTHFKVEDPTEGHTSVDQDLALKKRVVINFPSLDAQEFGNYQALQDVFEFARTSLKCLWMVDPRPVYIEKLTVFGKIVSLPEEEHNIITSDEYRVSLGLEIDEAK